jgi:hypothetical protein
LNIDFLFAFFEELFTEVFAIRIGSTQPSPLNGIYHWQKQSPGHEYRG